MKQYTRLVLCILIALCVADVARGELHLPAIFGDHMVLQRGMKVPIWGTATAKEKITVKALGQEKSTTADGQGNWRVILDPLQSDKPIEISITDEHSAPPTMLLSDVLVGEVWLCSGQSNMGFTLKSASNGAEAIAAANRPKIRLFTVGRKLPVSPQRDLEGKWELCTPESVPGFSAVAYFFGITLQEKLNQPIGLIQSSWGGTRAEAWMPRQTFDALQLPYEPAWTQEWLHPTSQPGVKMQPERPHEAPAILYNGMIAPIATYAMRGAVWYQGETNTVYGEHYARVLSALIKSWRDAWQEGDFPFLIVQLPNFDTKGRSWPITRQAQADVAQQLPNVGLVVTIDVGNPTNIHPTNKLPVGQRLAACAQKIAYGQDVPWTGPTFASMKIEGDRAIVKFDHLEGGLTSKGNVQGFEISGPDGKFVAADATIEGETVIVRAKGVDSPNAVRYGWQNAPTCTLYNQAGFPAAPFEAK